MPAAIRNITETKHRPARDVRAVSVVLIHPHSSLAGEPKAGLTIMQYLEHNTHPRKRALLPNNGRDPAAVQQFGDQVWLCVVAPNGAPGHFSAEVNGQPVVVSSRQPLLDAARVLINLGADTNSWIIMRHRGSDVDALRAKIGIAAALVVKEPDRGRVHFSRYVPLPFSPAAPPMRRNGKFDHLTTSHAGVRP
jgi:hypothetical protein